MQFFHRNPVGTRMQSRLKGVPACLEGAFSPHKDSKNVPGTFSPFLKKNLDKSVDQVSNSEMKLGWPARAYAAGKPDYADRRSELC
jgi:hypothetical protein